MDIFQKSITPDKPRVLAEEQIYVYVPMATSTNAGIASYNRDQFDIIGSEVSLKWPAESFTQGPIETPSVIKVLDNEFEYTGNLIDLISGNSKISSDKLEVQLKRILRDAYERPELVMLDPNYFVRTIVEKDGKQYYKYNTTAVHYNMSQTLSEYEQAQARQNISASSISDNEATNKRIDTLLQTRVYSINGKTGNVVLKNSDLENDTNYATEQYVQENGGKIDKIVLNNNEQEIINKIVTLTIDKTTVGLSNVDNTSDKNKPISDAAKQALDTKMDKSGGIFTGNVGVQGNLSVSGTITTKDTETLKVQDNVIVTNANKIDLLDLSGLAINKNNTQTYGIMYDVADDSVKLGLGSIDSNGKFNFNEGEGSPIATRSDSSLLTDNHLLKWDATNNKLVDSGYSAEDKLDKISTSSTYQRAYIVDTDGSQNSIAVSITSTAPNESLIKRDKWGCAEVDTPAYSDIGKRIVNQEYVKTHFYTRADDLKPQYIYTDTIYNWHHDQTDKTKDAYSKIDFTPYSTEILTTTKDDESARIKLGADPRTTPTVNESQAHVDISIGKPNDYSTGITLSNNYQEIFGDGISLYTYQNELTDARILTLSANGLFISEGLELNTETQTAQLKNKKEISPNVIRYDIAQTLTDDQKAQARANIGAGTGSGTGGTTVTVGGVAQETWDADSKVNTKVGTNSITINDSGITLANLKETAELGLTIGNDATLSCYGTNTADYIQLTTDNGTIIHHEKWDNSANNLVKSDLLVQDVQIMAKSEFTNEDATITTGNMGVFQGLISIGSQTSNGRGSVISMLPDSITAYVTTNESINSIIVHPDKIEIETTKLTYNGNEVATTNQIINKVDKTTDAGDRVYVSNNKVDSTVAYSSNANINAIVYRDINGRSKIQNPIDELDIANKKYVDENGGKIDKILLNNNEQTITNKTVNLTIDKTTVGLSNVDNTSDLDKPISTQTQTALDGLNQTITNNFNNLNSSIENETERATLAETEISTKLQQEMNTRVQEHSEIQGKIDTINTKIPNQASSTNQLADKDFVNSTINSSAAFFKGSFESKAALDAVEWQTTNSSLTTYVTNNDYAYVEADETHNNEAWRYIYVKDNTVSEWQPQFRVNESPFTQAQLDAINSGATTDLINSIGSKLTQDAIVDSTGDSSIKAISQRAATLGINTVQTNLNTHILDKNNPHQVTKAQIGLGNVDNTSDLDKPVSTAVQNALKDYLPLSGGNLTGNTSVNNKAKMTTEGYVVGTWLQATNTSDIGNSNWSDVWVNHNGWLYKRNKSNFINDLGLNNYVPITRTINSKALSSDITLNNKDVGALPDYTLTISHQSAGNPRMVKFVSVNYASAATCFKMGAMTCHDNGVSYQFLTDMLIAVTTGGEVTANIYKFAQTSIGNVDGVARYTGDVFYVNDTTNKIVDFYILCGQWSASQFTPVTKVGSTTIAYVTQYSGNANYYSSGDKTWVNGCGTTYARLSDIPTGAAADKGVVTTIDTSANLPTSNAVKTFVEGKGYVTTATYSTEAEALAASQADPNKLCFY